MKGDLEITGKEYEGLCRAYNRIIWKYRGRFIRKDLRDNWKQGYMRDDHYRESNLTWEE